MRLQSLPMSNQSDLTCRSTVQKLYLSLNTLIKPILRVMVHIYNATSQSIDRPESLTQKLLLRVPCRVIHITCSIGWNGRFVFKRPSVRIIILIFWKYTMHFNNVNSRKIALPSSKSNFRTFLCRAMFTAGYSPDGFNIHSSSPGLLRLARK